MKLVTALVFVCFAGFSASEYTEEQNVLVLGDANIDDAIKEFEYLLVEFCKFPCNLVGGVSSPVWLIEQKCIVYLH